MSAAGSRDPRTGAGRSAAMHKSKLSLRRDTIRNLSSHRLAGVAGAFSLGCAPTRFLCPTDELSVCRCLSDDCGTDTGGGTGYCPDSMVPNKCVTM